MPRFFFNIFDGHNLIDHEGVELPDQNAAQTFAIRHAGEVLRSDASRMKPDEGWRMEVTDETDRAILSLDFTVTQSPSRTSARALEGERSRTKS